jgi:TPR repeat protein
MFCYRAAGMPAARACRAGVAGVSSARAMSKATTVALAGVVLVAACGKQDQGSATPSASAVGTATAAALPSTSGSASRPRTAEALSKEPSDVLSAGCKRGDHVQCIALAGKELLAHYDEPGAYERAIEVFDAACKAGVMEGCSQLGATYGTEGLAFYDPVKARALDERACAGKDPLGCSNLGALYGTGRGVPRDDAKAAELYRQACDGGYLLACTNLGFFYEEGHGVAVDHARSLALFTRACDGDEMHGCANLGATYLQGNEKVAQNRATAITYYEKACKLHEVPSCKWLAKQGK